MRSRIYEITFGGEAGGALCAEFDDCEVIVGPDRATVRAEVPDQSAVVGLVLRISGLGLELIEMHRVAS